MLDKCNDYWMRLISVFSLIFTTLGRLDVYPTVSFHNHFSNRIKLAESLAIRHIIMRKPTFSFSHFQLNDLFALEGIWRLQDLVGIIRSGPNIKPARM